VFPQRFVLFLLFALTALGTSGCSSDAEPEQQTADTTATPTTTVSQAPPSDPAALTALEQRAEKRSVAEKIQDTSIETRVKRALVGTSALRVFPFRPTVIDGHLILRGDVNTPDQYEMAARVAGRVTGVDGLTNRLTMGGRPVTKARLNERDTSATNDTAVYHTVRPGDTLWDIARKYRATVQQIRNLNDFRSNNLRPGQRIRVR
jgi:LysM repeat protein